jgi:NADPH:quinone reductase-like Zn-dependent oxidoreductase
MRALQYAEYGPPEVLRVVDVEEPHAGTGQIRIAVKAAGVNPVDWKLRQGLMKRSLPAIPGSDVAGVVDEVGADVAGVSAGAAVFGFAVSGAAAQYAVMAHFAAMPAGMPFAEAAGLPVPVETAVRVLGLLGLATGQTLLINAAAGGVGVAAVQLARARGISVIGTASPDNHEFLRSLGAIPTTYGESLPERVGRLAPQGVDAAFDAAGRGALPELIAITGDADRVVTIADPEAGKYGVRFTGGAGDARAWPALAEAAELYARGEFSMPVAQTFPLAEGAQAHRVSEAGHVRGKLVLLVDS